MPMRRRFRAVAVGGSGISRPLRRSPAMFVPSSSTSPSDGISMRFTQRSSVDLPAPLGPITMTISPAVTARSTRSTTGTSPKIFDRPWMAQQRFGSHASFFSTYSENHASTEIITR